MSYCTSCTQCCQLCGDPSLDDCRTCRGEGLSEQERFFLIFGNILMGLMALHYFGREHVRP